MRKEEKTELTRAKIFAAAMTEFGTNGYAAGSVNNICRAGINKGLIYHNFRDKDELYLECVQKSCESFISYVIDQGAQEGFVEYMKAREEFFAGHEMEAYLFLEARTHPPCHLADRIGKIYEKFDELNEKIFEREISRHELRGGVSKEEALHYFMGLQKIYNLNFRDERYGKMSSREEFALHEMNIQKIFDLMLYGIAKGGNEE